MSNYLKQSSPYLVPTQDNKIIEEHFGIAASGHQEFSVAHMIAPPFWSEPFQNPEFDEVTIMIKGRKMIEVDGDKIELRAGETLLVKKGSQVKYSNPFPEPCEYWSLCVPAFSVEAVNRKG